MTNTRPKTWLTTAIRRIAALEYALIEACYSAASSAGSLVGAALNTRAGTAQVHLFDLGTALRELGDLSLNYSHCVRESMLQSGSPDEVMRRLERESERMIRRPDVPDGLRVLLRANLAEHRGIYASLPAANSLAV
jgi:hypothetical protein